MVPIGIVDTQVSFDFLAGTLTKPKIWAEPHSVIAMYAPVTIWCQGSWEAKRYHLFKEGSTDPWDQQSPLEDSDKVKFYIQHMTEDFAGIYKCYYQSPAGWSEHSDTLEMVLTGVHDNPSLSVWPSPAVTSGETITIQCSSSLGFGRFILIQEEKHHLQWTLDSQPNANWEFQAHFVLDPVTAIHNGTFRCYGYYRNHPQVWSKSSDPLHLLVSGLGRYQKVLIGVLVSLLLDLVVWMLWVNKTCSLQICENFKYFVRFSISCSICILTGCFLHPISSSEIFYW
uniref:Ig-like domain-containing protein n=1 Tax=Peromyscus maniculatus bairdii TaxID=230844 RepID=A0A8C8VYH2_PERMB